MIDDIFNEMKSKGVNFHFVSKNVLLIKCKDLFEWEMDYINEVVKKYDLSWMIKNECLNISL